MTAEDVRQLLAVFCAAENDITGALCARTFCDGLHSADGDTAWTTTTDTEESP